MGAAGAGLATLISSTAAVIYYIVLNRAQKGKTLISLNPRDFSFKADIWKKIAGVGIPASIQNLLNVTGMILLNNFTAVYGPSAITAMGIANKIQVVPFQMVIGTSQGVMPLISYNYGNENHQRMKETIQYIAIRMMVFLVGTFIIGALFARPLMAVFMNQADVIHYGTRFLFGMLLAMPFIGIDFLAVGVFQAIGDGRKALMFAILRKIIFEIPGLIILNHIFSIYGLVYAQVIGEIVLSIIAIKLIRDILH